MIYETGTNLSNTIHFPTPVCFILSITGKITCLLNTVICFNEVLEWSGYTVYLSRELGEGLIL